MPGRLVNRAGTMILRAPLHWASPGTVEGC
jgi:hypothetical protein